MTTPSAQLRLVLAQLATDRRRSIAYYGNALAAPGSSTIPRRLLSDFGFPTDTQFQYVVPALANVTINREPRTAINHIVLNPYGLLFDRTRLVATAVAQRRVSLTRGPGTRGVALYPGRNDLYISAELDDQTYLEQKTTDLIQNLTTVRGPAYHFVITRRGDIIVCAALDDEVFANRNLSTTCISVALEGALAITVSDWTAKRFTNLIELPYNEMQLFTLRVLYAKLQRAIPAITQEFVTTDAAGFSYQFPNNVTGAKAFCFTNNEWRSFNSPLNYETSDISDFISRVNALSSFDLTTQVFRPPQAPAARATRAAARSVISQINTVGELSPALIAYASLAGVERANESASLTRSRFFVRRINVAQRDADDTNSQQSAVENTAGIDEPPAIANSGSSIFDFTTGYWQDPEPKPY
jgi:hypothetical protein